MKKHSSLHIKLSYDDEENNLSAALLTEDEQVVNAGRSSLY